MLAFYAERFAATEINYSFRRIPSPKTISHWSETTPQSFKFSLKAPQKITHFAKLRNCADTLAYFHQVVSALGTKLGPILFQLPPSFKSDAGLLSAFLETVPTGMSVAFEFRHPSWFSDEIFAILQGHNAALCIAESADLSTPAVATAGFGYLRLRRADYTTVHIAKWAEHVQTQAARWRDAFIYFKHEESGVGPQFAAQMQRLLQDK